MYFYTNFSFYSHLITITDICAKFHPNHKKRLIFILKRVTREFSLTDKRPQFNLELHETESP